MLEQLSISNSLVKLDGRIGIEVIGLALTLSSKMDSCKRSKQAFVGNTSKMTHPLLRILGIGGAVPAIAVAALTLPNTFQAGALLSAADLNENFSAVGDELAAQAALITSLQQTVAELEAQSTTLQTQVAAMQVGSLVALTPFGVNDVNVANPVRVWQAGSAGVVVAVPNGGSHTAGDYNLYIGDPEEGEGCPSDTCTRVARSVEGDSFTAAVPAGARFTVTADLPADATATVDVHFMPLGGSAPTLVR
jgi:hypothetical protein